MDKLPFELFFNIISLLPHESRLACQRVCRNWYSQVMKTNLLLETVMCRSGHAFTHTMIPYYTKHKEIAAKAQTLDINCRASLDIQLLQELHSTFPNIKHFKLHVCQHGFSASSPISRMTVSRQRGESVRGLKYPMIRNVLDEWDQLESLEETSTVMYSASILNNVRAPLDRLTNIWLNYAHIGESIIEESIAYLCKGLKQAPCLQEISLFQAQVTLDDLDTLHNNCPQVQSITLSYTSIRPHPAGSPQRRIAHRPPLHYTPQPAATVKSIQIFSAEFLNGVPILPYLTVKYPNVETFVCERNLSKPFWTDNTYEGEAVILLNTYNNLKSFRCNLFSLSPTTMRLLLDKEIGDFKEFVIEDPDEDGDEVKMLPLICSNKRANQTMESLTMDLHHYKKTFNDMLLNLSNLTSLKIRSANIEYDDDIAIRQLKYTKFVPLDVLLTKMSHLKSLDLSGLRLRLTGTMEVKAPLKDLTVTDSYFESFNNPATGKLYSIFNMISESCLELENIKVSGKWHRKPHAYELTLNLLNHKKMKSLEVFIHNYMPYIRHVDSDKIETLFSVEHTQHRGATVNYYKLNGSLQGKHRCFTIICNDEGLFYPEFMYKHHLPYE